MCSNPFFLFLQNPAILSFHFGNTVGSRTPKSQIDFLFFQLQRLLSRENSSLGFTALDRRFTASSRSVDSNPRLLACLFAAHPVHTESICYVVGRADILCAQADAGSPAVADV